MLFQDRQDAGYQLAKQLTHYRDELPLVLALPRGGVPVGYQIAKALNAPLDVLVVRKLGVPYQPELGMGAIGPGGVCVLNDPLIRSLGITHDEIDEVAETERREMARRMREFRGERPMIDVSGRTVILVDDGLATGITTRAAILALKSMHPRKIVLAVPIGAISTVQALRHEVDELVCLHVPEHLEAVGYWYRDFRQTSDEEVIQLLEEARQELPSP